MPILPSPALSLSNHQEIVPVDLHRLEQMLPRAVAAVVAVPPGPADTLLPGLEEIELSLLSDEEIARQHEAFLGDPTPTDVITFHHGELLLSAETGARECLRVPHALERELLLYAVHGLLHLHGYGDSSAPEQTRMQAIQDKILLQLWPE